MNRTLTLFVIIAVAYMIGARWPGIARQIGFA